MNGVVEQARQAARKAVRSTSFVDHQHAGEIGAGAALVVVLDHMDHLVASVVNDRADGFTVREEIGRLRKDSLGLTQ